MIEATIRVAWMRMVLNGLSPRHRMKNQRRAFVMGDAVLFWAGMWTPRFYSVADLSPPDARRYMRVNISRMIKMTSANMAVKP